MAVTPIQLSLPLPRKGIPRGVSPSPPPRASSARPSFGRPFFLINFEKIPKTNNSHEFFMTVAHHHSSYRQQVAEQAPVLPWAWKFTLFYCHKK